MKMSDWSVMIIVKPIQWVLLAKACGYDEKKTDQKASPGYNFIGFPFVSGLTEGQNEAQYLPGLLTKS